MTASGPDLIALHGFLGLASDWQKLSLNTEAVDLWVDVGDDIETWAARFNHEVSEFVPKAGPKPCLLGYSMGGRLAMAAVTRAPHLYSSAIFVSAHPGLDTEVEKRERLANDKAWAARFRSEAWATLMKAWAMQPVLKRPPLSQIGFERAEKEFDRERLATALVNWSLGRQPNFRERLENLTLPTLFVSGERDTKFTALLDSVKRHRVAVVPGAGHRVPWDEPAAFEALIRDFLAAI